ncbi:hypothetical protein DL89DRAFT_290734 [Linderina pennispora]|uniref:Bax inhibitor family protein n=1 Tax=Linderina pennispora TaxID=61395 RepID=A0A1Y1WH93_9FUNG|nr:uncharacterized protein DL89DRAFT_290734 [Linderina pennispora]ORX72940.1 hypothetical protein DL89DRAFT_290734 [Linderina pennispora]
MDAETLFRSYAQISDLPPKTQRQVLDVYLTLASTVASAIMGTYVSLHTNFIHPLLASILLMRPTKDNLTLRRTLLWTSGYMTGALLMPLCSEFLYHNPGILYGAMGSAAVLFASFALGVVMSTRRQVIYMIGVVAFALGSVAWVSLVNFFFPTRLLLTAEMYLALASTCVYVVLHTQLMLDEARLGDLDPVAHALVFFNDLVRLFVQILAIMAKNERSREEEEDSRRRRRKSGRTSHRSTAY